MDHGFRKFFYLVATWHYLLTVAFYLNSLSGTDATYYFETGSTLDSFEWGTGRFFILGVTYLLTRLDLDYPQITFIFSSLGLLGILWTGEMAFRFADTRKQRRFAKVLFLLPGIHFWSAGIGKDSLIVFAFGLTLYGVWKGSWLRLIPALTTSIMARPYFGGPLFIAAVYPGLLFKTKRNRRPWLLVATAAMLAMVHVSASLMGFSNVEESLEFLESRKSVLNYGTYGASFVNYPFIVRAVYLVAYPLAPPTSPLLMVIVMENLVSAWLLFNVAHRILAGKLEATIWKNDLFIFCLTTFVFLDATLALSDYNLGIIVRHEVVPVLALIVIYFVTATSIKIPVYLLNASNGPPIDLSAFLSQQGIELVRNPALVKSTRGNLISQIVKARDFSQGPLRIVEGRLVRRIMIDFKKKKITLYLRAAVQ